ncbi:hypothetical protein EXN66_Car008435 [Channa argus]|uniref:Uncharacterized protein n=1 Tax=Channa argus TaxID=215402 RepID=A0A6G1PRA3_CHAAH|nr:hypothetical protein EXN66_Car008435 [Channa argus]
MVQGLVPHTEGLGTECIGIRLDTFIRCFHCSSVSCRSTLHEATQSAVFFVQL